MPEDIFQAKIGLKTNLESFRKELAQKVSFALPLGEAEAN